MTPICPQLLKFAKQNGGKQQLHLGRPLRRVQHPQPTAGRTAGLYPRLGQNRSLFSSGLLRGIVPTRGIRQLTATADRRLRKRQQPQHKKTLPQLPSQTRELPKRVHHVAGKG